MFKFIQNIKSYLGPSTSQVKAAPLSVSQVKPAPSLPQPKVPMPEVPLVSGEYVAIDFETANEKRSSACAVGIAVVNMGKIIETKSWLIKPPELRFNHINIGKHGIKEAMVKNAPRFNELWPTLFSYLHKKTVVAHNAGFDIGVLRNCLEVYQLTFPDVYYSCTMRISKRVWTDLDSYKLNLIAKDLGISFNHHDPVEDAKAAAEISIRACKANKVDSLKELMSAIGLKRKRLN